MRIVAVLALLSASANALRGQDAASVAACVSVLAAERTSRMVGMSRAAWDSVFIAGERCVPLWADSLRSPVAARAGAARDALTLIGGRRAVDALRAEFERAQNLEVLNHLIEAMGSTGSPDDIKFLQTQLFGPLLGTSGRWWVMQTALNTLGLLRATEARDSIRSVARRGGSGSFAHRAATAALESLDRPACTDDSARTDTSAALAALVMRCRPEALGTTARYYDSGAEGVWEYRADRWQLVSGARRDSAQATISIDVRIAPGGRHAEARLSMWCGSLCGEGWVFRLIYVGLAWRVISASMMWVS